MIVVAFPLPVPLAVVVVAVIFGKMNWLVSWYELSDNDVELNGVRFAQWDALFVFRISDNRNDITE